MIKPKFSLATLAVGVVVCASTSTAHATGDTWWTPGFCKANLQRHGVQLSDRRYFHIAKAFCVGRGGGSTCHWFDGVRYYSDFIAFVRAYDGVVRGLFLETRGKDDYSISSVRALGRMGPGQFAAAAGKLAA